MGSVKQVREEMPTADVNGAEVAVYTRQVNVRIEEAQHQKLRELDVAAGNRSELIVSLFVERWPELGRNVSPS